MEAGLTIYNVWGTVQIDQYWKNYGFRQKIPLTITAYWSTGNTVGYNGVTYQLVTPGTPQLLVACRASVLLPIKLWSWYDGTNWTITWLFMKWLPPVSDGTEFDPVTETVDFYVFDAMNGSYSNVGLEVFNPDGERVFHSDAPVMKLGSTADDGVQGCDTGFVGASGHVYVPLIMGDPLIASSPGFPIGFRLYSYGLRSIGNTIQSSVTRELGALNGSSPYSDPGLYAAIDVTGL